MTRIFQQDGVTIVELDERYDSLDDDSIKRLSSALLEVATHSDPPVILLDLSNTRLIGSRFIGLLVRVWKRIQDRKGRMGLCCVPPFCREALVTTRLYDTLWGAYETRDEGIAVLK